MDASKPWECPACGKGPANGLTLTPSGKQISRHKDGQEVCEGKAPKTPDPEPIKVVPANSKPNSAECVECGVEMLKLKTPGKVRKHTNPQTLAECEQRPDVAATDPLCGREIPLYRMRFKNHKDLKANSRCPGSGKTVLEATQLAQEGKKAPTKAKAAPKAKQSDGYKDLSPVGKSQFKATKLGNELKAYPDPWRFTVEVGPDPDQATLVARRGKANDVEEMRISWWAGACLGGEGKITHEYKGRKIAVRNANAVRQRGQMTHEAIQAEASKVSVRKANGNGGPKAKKTPEQLQELMPFDPKKADDAEVLAALKEGRTIRWNSPLKGKVENDVLKKLPKQPLSRTKTGIRNLTFTGANATRTVRVENLVSVG